MASSPTLGVPVRITCDATAGNVTQVNIPRGAVSIILRPITAAGKVHTSGTDGAAIGAAYVTLSADAGAVLPCAGNPALYIASAANSGVIEVVCLPAVS